MLLANNRHQINRCSIFTFTKTFQQQWHVLVTVTRQKWTKRKRARARVSERERHKAQESHCGAFSTQWNWCVYICYVSVAVITGWDFSHPIYTREGSVCASCWTKHTMCSTRKWDLVQIIFTPVTMVNGSFDVWWVNSRRFLFWFQSFFKWYTYDWYQGRRVWFSEFYVSQIEMRINLCMPFVTLGGQRIQIRIVAWKCMQWHIAHIQKCWRKGTLRVIP